jgi:hypothetical protein
MRLLASPDGSCARGDLGTTDPGAFGQETASFLLD